jgi:2-polyprenyl-6-methoxyphenol hydroxylase-like FAD-dependent oxidoreductase
MTSIAIIGGGIGGLTTALALRQFGFEPEVFEQAPALLDVGAAIAIWPNALRVLEHLGLGEKLMQKAGVIQEVRWLDQHGRLVNSVAISESNDARATPAIALHRADLQSTLLHALPATSIHLGNALVSQKQEGDRVTASFANGNTVDCDLLIGADGIHSRVRSQLLDDASPTYRGYAVWRGIAPISPASIPPNTAVEIHGRGRRFGIGPVGLGRVGWWAAANAANTSPRVEERRGDRKTWKQGESVTPNSSHNTQRELLRLFDGWYRPVLQLIEASPSTSILKTGAFDGRATRNWGSGNRSLLGDAIHPTTPNLGQGGCMAIEDAVILAKCIHKYGADIEALRTYERLRYKRTSAVTRYSRHYGAIGQWENLFATGLRKAMLSLVPERLARRIMQIVFNYDASSAKI